MKSKFVCESCGYDGNERSHLLLWDGFDYCGSCLPYGSELHSFALKHSALEETLPFGVSEVLRKNLIFSGLTAIGSAALFSCVGLCGVADASLLNGVVVFLIMLVISVFVTLLFLLAGISGFTLNRPTIRLQFGVLTVQSNLSKRNFNLSEMMWHKSKLSLTTMIPNGVLLPNCDAIILEFPRKNSILFRERIPVGMTNETRNIWIAFLRIAAIPQMNSVSPS